MCNCVCFFLEFLYVPWMDLVGKESFLFAQGTDVFKRREAIDCEISSSTREHYAKVFLSVRQNFVFILIKLAVTFHSIHNSLFYKFVWLFLSCF